MGGGVWECPAVHRWLSVGSLSRLWGPCAPLLFHRPSLKCLGDDREIVGVCQRMTSTCQESACSGRRLLEKETRKDGWIRHSHLSVNIHDVIFSLKGRLCLRASTIAATVVSVWRGITGFFFLFVLGSCSDLMRKSRCFVHVCHSSSGEVIRFQSKTGGGGGGSDTERRHVFLDSASFSQMQQVLLFLPMWKRRIGTQPVSAPLPSSSDR